MVDPPIQADGHEARVSFIRTVFFVEEGGIDVDLRELASKPLGNLSGDLSELVMFALNLDGLCHGNKGNGGGGESHFVLVSVDFVFNFDNFFTLARLK